MSASLQGAPDASIDAFRRAFSRVRGYLGDESPWSLTEVYNDEATVLAETLIALGRLLKEKNLGERGRHLLGIWQTEVAACLNSGLSMNHMFMLHYLRNNSSRDLQSAIERTIRVLIAARALAVSGPRFALADSMLTSFLDALPILSRHIDEQSLWADEAQRSHLGFLLLNCIETATEFKGREQADYAGRQLLEVAKRRFAQYPDMFGSYPGLSVYANDLNSRLSLGLNLPSPSADYRGKSACFHLLEVLERGDEPSEALMKAAEQSDSPHLWWAASQICHLRRGLTEIYVEPPTAHIPLSDVFGIVWRIGEGFSATKVTEEEISVVRTMYDSDVKTRLVEFFRSHPQLSQHARAMLEREASKGHGPAEISDFDLAFETQAGPLYVSIPIKTSHEAPKSTSERFTDSVIGQFLRPFERLGSGRTCVFPVILSEQTLNAIETEKSLRANLGLRLQVIDISTFAKLLKFHRISPFDKAE